MKTIKVKSYKEIPDDFTGIVHYPDESKEWYEEGKIHREDGPACEYSNGDKYWYKDGNRHREDGPAIEYSDGSGEWWVNGFYYHPISLKNYVVFDYWQGEYGIMWYRLLGKDKIFEYPDIPGLIIE